MLGMRKCSSLGNYVAQPMQMDSTTKRKVDRQFGRIKVIYNSSESRMTMIPLWVEDLKYFVLLKVDPPFCH